MDKITSRAHLELATDSDTDEPALNKLLLADNQCILYGSEKNKYEKV